MIGAGIGLSTTFKGKFELKSFQIGDVKSYSFSRVYSKIEVICLNSWSFEIGNKIRPNLQVEIKRMAS